MSTVKFLKAAIDSAGVDNLVNYLAKLNLDIKVYSRLLFGLDNITQRDVETYVIKKNNKPVRKITYEVDKYLLNLYNVTIRYEIQGFRYIKENDIVPENKTVKEFGDYCVNHNITYADGLKDEYTKPIPVWVKDSMYAQIEEITE